MISAFLYFIGLTLISLGSPIPAISHYFNSCQREALKFQGSPMALTAKQQLADYLQPRGLFAVRRKITALPHQ
jgi:hypothetical protein